MTLPFYGRTRELEVLRSSTDSLLVVGPGGVGKTRLVEQVLPTQFCARAKAGWSQEPYAVVGQLLAQVLEVEDRERIQQALGSEAALVTAIVPGWDAPPNDELVCLPDPSAAARRLSYVFGRFLQEACCQHAWVWFVDDWQWMDPGSQALWPQVLSCRTIRVLGTSREPYHDDTNNSPIQQLFLEPWSCAETQAIWAQHAPEQETPLYETTQGYPLQVVAALSPAPPRSEAQERVLQVAAHLPGTLHVEFLRGLLPDLEEDLSTVLEELCDLELLRRTGEQSYVFVHDRLKESVRDDSDVQRQVGVYLLERWGEHDSWVLFAAIGLLHALPIAIDCKDALLEADIAAGDLSFQGRVYSDAAVHYQNAIALLQPNHWTDRYEECLRIYRNASDSLFCTGSIEEGIVLVETLLQNARCERDKVESYGSLGRAYGLLQRHKDAVRVLLQALAILGEQPPRLTLASMLMEIRRLKSEMMTMEPAELLDMPEIEDPDVLKTLEILMETGTRALFCNRPDIVIYAVVRGVRLLLVHGQSAYAAVNLSSLTLVTTMALGMIEFGQALGQLTLAVGEARSDKLHGAKLLYNIAQGIACFSVPVANILPDMSKGYLIGMETGDIDHALHCLMASSQLCYASGYPLEPILDDAELTYRVAVQFKSTMHQDLVYPFVELLRYLMNRGDLPDWSNEGRASLRGKHEVKDRYRELSFFSFRCDAAVIMGDALLADLARRVIKRLMKGDIIFTSILHNSYVSGMASLLMLRRTGRRKYATIAKGHIKELERLAKIGALNVNNKILILRSILFSLQRSRDLPKVKKHLDKAIGASTRAGQLLDSALVNEWCGELHMKKDPEWGRFYVGRAYHQYMSLGAARKAKQLLSKWGGSMSFSDPSCPMRTTFKDRKGLVESQTDRRGSMVDVSVRSSLCKLADKNPNPRSSLSSSNGRSSISRASVTSHLSFASLHRSETSLPSG